jgi:hypothetical protein
MSDLKINVLKNHDRQAIRSAWVEETRQRIEQHDEGKRQAFGQRPKDEAIAAAFAAGRQGQPARRDLIADAFQGQQPRQEHHSSQQDGDPALKLAAELFPEVFSTAQEGHQQAPATAPDAQPVPADTTPAAAQQSPAPTTTAELFRTIQDTVQSLSTTPAPTDAAAIRNHWRELGDTGRAAIQAKVERESYGVEGYLSVHSREIRDRLLQAELEKRLSDARQLDPAYSVEALIGAMAGGQ